MPVKPPFRIAVVGCGGVSSMHFEGCARRPDRVEVVAVCDLDAAKVAATQQKYGIPQGFSTLAEMIAQSEWDVAIVCTPTSVRESVVSQLAQSKRHVFVEKPFASSLEEGARMVECCEKSGVLLAVDQNFRFHFPFHLAKAQIEADLLGRVTAIHHQHLCFRQDSGWRTLEKRHFLEIMGVHWLDGFRWITGSEGASVVAQMRHSHAIECAGETDLSVQVALENGALASYVDSCSSMISRCETLVIGERGTLRLEHDGATFFDRSGAPQPAQTWKNPFAGAGKPDSAFEGLDQLLTALESCAPIDNSGRDNLKTLALMEAAYRSAESGQTVTLREGLL